jgi:hypothetical protein
MPDSDPAPALPDLHTLVVGRDAMACRFEVLFNAGEVPDATELGLAALDLVDSIEARITVYRDSSALARINATAAEGWQPLEGDLVGLLAHARDLHRRTSGGFDPAAGSLVRVWGFLRRQGRRPDAATLAVARAASGMEHVEIDTDAVEAWLRGVKREGGGIGKSARTVNHHRQSLVAFLSWCVERGRLRDNPAVRVKPLRTTFSDKAAPVRGITSIGNSRLRHRTGFGSLTLLMSRPGLALFMSPSSLTRFRAELLAGVSAVRRIRGSCLMRWSRLCMTGGPCIAAAWSITATGAANMSR